jgi:hypothetical protein
MLAIRAVHRNIVDRRSARLELTRLDLTRLDLTRLDLTRRPENALVVLESRFAASLARP